MCLTIGKILIILFPFPPGKFTIEDSLGRNTWVTVITEESGDVDGLTLISPTGKEFEFAGHADGLVFLRIPGVTEVRLKTNLITLVVSQEAMLVLHIPRPACHFLPDDFPVKSPH